MALTAYLYIFVKLEHHLVMIWKARYIQPKNDNGTIRLKRVFAWMPTYVKGDIVWLVHYEILQLYRVEILPAFIDGKQASIEYGQWLNIETRIIK